MASVDQKAKELSAADLRSLKAVIFKAGIFRNVHKIIRKS